jgi:hypothetical protein
MQRSVAAVLMLAAAMAGGIMEPANSVAADVTVPVAARQELAVTLYANGDALVRDVRKADLAKGESTVAFPDVSPQMQAGTARLAAGDAVVSSIVNDFNVLSPEALLRRSVGREIGVVRRNPQTGAESIERGVLLSQAQGLVIRFGDRIETGQPERLVFFDQPADLRLQPTLFATMAVPTAGGRDLALTYLAGGLSWSADSVIDLARYGRSLDLTGRATLENRSGIALPDAALALVAGDVQRQPTPRPAMMMRDEGFAMRAAPAAAPPEREELSDLHLYTLPQKVSLPEDTVKQVALLSADDVAVSREYISERAIWRYARRTEKEESHPEVRLTFINAAGKGPGQPLPAGLARIFAVDAGGAQRLVGEARIPHTPVGGEVRLSPARAFDITVTRRQTDFAKVAESVVETAFSITIKNAKAEPVTVIVRETIDSAWEMLSESQPHTKETASQPTWKVAVPAGGEATLTYKVRLREDT